MSTSSKHAKLLESIESVVPQVQTEIAKAERGAEALDGLKQLQFILAKLTDMKAVLHREDWQSKSRPKSGLARLIVDTSPLNHPLGVEICEIEYDFERLK